MIGIAIVLTFVVTSLTLIVIFQKWDRALLVREIEKLKSENGRLKRDLEDVSDQSQFQRECSAYSRGLYDARKTDTLYRSMLKTVSAENRNSAMMDGFEGGNEK